MVDRRGLVWGIPVALGLLAGCALNLVPALLCVVFTVWRGAGILGSALVLLTMLGFQMAWGQVSLLHPEIPFRLAGPIAVLSVLLAFLVTRHALLHGSRPYRVQPTPFGGFAWGAGR